MSAKDEQIERLREQNALLIQRLFGRKSEQSSDPDSPQLEIFNKAESLAEAAPEAFIDTPKGATASAQFYSLVETAEANGQEPYAYLRHILECLPQAKAVADYEALLPWRCAPAIAY